MQRNFTLLLSLFLVLFGQAAVMAQGTIDNGFIFSINSGTGGVQRSYAEGDCGWEGAEYGGAVTTPVTGGDIVWGYDAVPIMNTTRPDSLFCDTTRTRTAYAGKWVMARRGTCFFYEKALNAQKAGAAVVILVNHFLDPAQNDCTTFPVGLGANPTPADIALAGQIKIPVIVVGRAVGAAIDRELKAGRKVTGSFLFAAMAEPTLPAQYATPLSHVDTVSGFATRLFNRGTTAQTNITVTASIKEPGTGAPKVLTQQLGSLAAGKDTLVSFTGLYVVPKVKGTYTVTFSNNKFTNSFDTVRQNFVVTDHTFAVDNFSPSIGLRTASGLEGPDYFYAAGAWYFTGDARNTKSTHISFGIANAAEIFVANRPDANLISCTLYDANADNDNDLDLNSSFEDMEPVGLGTYSLRGNEAALNTIDVELTQLDGTPGVPLKPNHDYFAVISYTGREAAVGRPASSPVPPAPAYVGSAGINYPYDAYLFEQTGLFVLIGNPGAPIVRMQLEGYKPITSVDAKPLDAEKLVVLPNPATDLLRVDLDLAAKNEKVTMVLVDWMGRLVRTQVLSNFEAGVVNLNVADLPSGNYILSVQTEEGRTARKVAICH